MAHGKESEMLTKLRLGIKEAFAKAKMESTLPGDLVLLTPDRYSDAMEFLNKYYIADEPCSVAGGQAFTDDLKQFWYLKPFCCEYGMTVLLLKRGTSDIIAIQAIDVEMKGGKRRTNVIKDISLKKTVAIKDHVVDKIDIYEKFGIDFTVRFLHLAVTEEYKRRGIASRLIDFCLEVYRKLEIRQLYAKVHCSSIYSRRAFEKNGFEVVSSVNYRDYFVDDQLVFPNMGVHDSFCYLVTKIT